MAKRKLTVGSNQHKQSLQPDGGDANSAPEISLTTTNPYMTLGPELVASRNLLLRVLELLEEQSAALTVLGAHAVFEQTKTIIELPSMDSTHDADVGVTPELLAPTPLLDEMMDSAGLEPANPARPGVWGLKSEHDKPLYDRLTIDLIAPSAIAGNKRRSADVGAHGAKSVSKTSGTELSVIDRDWMEIESFDNDQPSREGYVAGVAALICAKVYKIYDRLDPAELARNPARSKPKDATDLFRLIVAKNGVDVRAVFDRGIRTPQIADAVVEGKRRLLDLRDRDEGRWITSQVLLQWGDDVLSAGQIQRVVDDWFNGFGD